MIPGAPIVEVRDLTVLLGGKRRWLRPSVPAVRAVGGVSLTVQPGEMPRAYVMRMARQKALAVRDRGEPLPVLAADTTVVLDDVIYGKPRDRDEGVAMLQRFSDRVHEVMTAVAIADAGGVALRLNVSSVRFRKLSPEECNAYWETGEPRDKAGGYAVQGAAAVFIESLSGSYSGVMGLPLFETAELLRAAGIAYWEGI